MAIQLDFTGSRAAIARFNQFLQYDLLDQMRSTRDAEMMQIQDKLMRERQVQAGEIEKDVAEYKSGLTERESYIKAMLDIAKLPEADYLVSMARMAMNPQLPPEFREQSKGAAAKYADMVMNLSLSYFKASHGIGNANDAYAALRGGGVKGLTDWMQENGINWRTTQQETGTTGRTKMTEENKIAGERRKGYVDLVQASKVWLSSQGVIGESLTGDVRIFMENKTLNPVDKKDQSYALSMLTEIEMQLLDQGPDSLTPGQKKFISNSWNAWGMNEARLGMGAGAAPGAAPGAAATPGAAPPAGRQGAINAETGMTPQEERTLYTAMRKNLYATKLAEAIRMTYGAGYSPTPQELREIKKAIKKYVDQRIGPSLWKNWGLLMNEPIE